MQINIGAKLVQQVLYVLAMVIFIGLCIQAFGFLFNACITLLLKPEGAERFWREIDLSHLYHYDKGHFGVLSVLISIVAFMKALMFYLIVKILHDKKLNTEQPFRKETGRFIFHLAYLTLAIGLFASRGAAYIDWMKSKGVTMPSIQHAGLGGADVWLFMSVTLFVIAFIFKRGIVMQTENELTV